jgi:hypothetical protein
MNANRPDHDKMCASCGYANNRVRDICKSCRQPLDGVRRVSAPRFSPWPLVRHVLIPTWLLIVFGSLVAQALQVPNVELASTVLLGGMPVLGGYLARRRGATYGGALNTMWVTIWVGLAMCVPLLLLAYETGAQTPSPQLTQLWSTLQQQGPGPMDQWLLAIPLAAVMVFVIALVVWLCWLPFTLLGAWIGARD